MNRIVLATRAGIDFGVYAESINHL